MDDETKIKLLKRICAVLAVLITITFCVAAVFGYYNCTTERPARELFYPSDNKYEDHSARPDR